MIESGSCSGRSTASVPGISRRPTPRITAGRMSAANAVRTGTAGTTSAATGVGTAAAVRAAATGTAVKTAAVGAVPTSTGVEMATTMRTTAMGPAVRPAAVRTFPVMLSERGVGARGEHERDNRCKQEAYRREFRHFASSTLLARFWRN